MIAKIKRVSGHADFIPETEVHDIEPYYDVIIGDGGRERIKNVDFRIPHASIRVLIEA